MDWRLYKWCNRLQAKTAWAHTPMRIYAEDGIALFALAILAGWWLARHRPDDNAMAAAIWAPVAALFGLGANQVIGHLVHRARPYATHSGVHVLVARTQDFSFPSDHAVVAGAVAAAVWFVDRRLGLLTATLALIMAFARVYVGAHYPGDVAAGLAVGVVIAAGLSPLGTRAIRPVVAWLRTGSLGRVLVGGGRVGTKGSA